MASGDAQPPGGAPLVSVVIPTFDRAALLPRAIESVLHQTYDPVEAVVVDDGSTDDTASLLRRLAAEHPGRLTWETKPNGGCASARNLGLTLARGELLAFLDSDDEWLPDAAETLAAALRAEQAEFAYSPAVEVEPDGREWVNYPVAAGRPRSLAVEHFLRTNLRNGAFLFRRDVLETVGYLDERLRHNEDSDFVQRLAIECRAAYSPLPTVRVHWHGANKSGDRVAITQALIESADAVLQRYPAFAETLGAAAGARLKQLRADHVEALARASQYGRAAELARGQQLSLALPVRLALLLRSRLPLEIEARRRAVLRRLLA